MAMRPLQAILLLQGLPATLETVKELESPCLLQDFSGPPVSSPVKPTACQFNLYPSWLVKICCNSVLTPT